MVGEDDKENAMSRYVNADALGNTIVPMVGLWEDNEFYISYKRVFEIIENAPSIDIVRCKECKLHRTLRRKDNGEFYKWCRANFRRVDDDDFCSFGERGK